MATLTKVSLTCSWASTRKAKEVVAMRTTWRPNETSDGWLSRVGLENSDTGVGGSHMAMIWSEVSSGSAPAKGSGPNEGVGSSVIAVSMVLG